MPRTHRPVAASALLALLLSTPAAGLEGSDSEYFWSDSDEPGGAVFSWADLENTGGSDLGLSAGGTSTIGLPFSFPFDGSTVSSITVSAYGYVTPGTGTGPGAWSSGDCVGDGSVSGAFIAPMWSDWDLALGGAVYTKTYADALIVEWDSVYTSSGETSARSFGLVLYESGEIAFTLRDTTSGDVNTQRGLGTATGVQYAAGDGLDMNCDTSTWDNTGDGVYASPWGLRHLAGEIDAEDHALAVVEGAAASDRFGQAVEVVADLDADGLAELLVTAPYADDGGSNAGAVYLFMGSDLSGTVDAADAWMVIEGGAASDNLGQSLSAHGDVDGDGLPDALMGVPYEDTGATNAGAAVLLLSDALAAGGSLDLDDADALLSGEDRNDGAGTAVAIVGDVDDDGYADMVVGAPNQDDGGTSAGMVYLVLGGAGPSDTELGSADAEWQGEAAGDYAGYTVSGTGDLDDDGYADFVIGAYGNDDLATDAGAIYVVLGEASPSGTTALSTADQISGEAASSSTGIGLGWAGDLDGDGVDDLLAGAFAAGSGNEGAAYVVSGTSGGSFTGSMLTADFRADGSSSDRLGADLASLDLHDDGDMAVVAGAYGNSAGASAAGGAYIFDATAVASGSATADEAWGLLTGADTAGYLGASVATGDVDGSGYPEVAVGAYGADGGANGSGIVVVVQGRPTWPDADGDGHISTRYGGLDCDDGDASLGPSNADDCDGIDNDCNGTVDDGYADTDADGTADCVDTEECDGLDNDGDGSVDEGMPDTDGDGTCDALDSEDCDGLDNDGDGLVDEDFSDTDGDGIADCMDTEECDGLDNDGNGTVDDGYPDTDGDGVADCVDEETCDGLDNDGDGLVDEDFEDTDFDGIADCVDEETCDALDNDGDGLVDEDQSDVDGDGICDDLDTETCDGVDNDGDTWVDEDFEDNDGDGIADCIDGEDCDGVDNNGDGQVDEGYPDVDADGIADCVDEEVCDGQDNDGDGLVDEGSPDADYDGVPDCLDSEDCDGLDNNGDGAVDEGFADTDQDGAADCIDVETCDGADNDGDGLVDEGFYDEDRDGVADCIDREVFVEVAPRTGTVGGGGGCSALGSAGGGFVALFGLILGLGRRRE